MISADSVYDCLQSRDFMAEVRSGTRVAKLAISGKQNGVGVWGSQKRRAERDTEHKVIPL